MTQFGNTNENDIPLLERLNDTPPQIRPTPHQEVLIDNQIDANKGKIKGVLCLGDFFGFCKSFKRGTKNLGFHLMLKTNDLQDIIYTSMADDINVTINSLYLFIPNMKPSVETQVVFIEATQNNYKTCYDEWYTERRLMSDLLVQHDIGSAQQVNSLEYLIGPHQTSLRTTTPDEKF